VGFLKKLQIFKLGQNFQQQKKKLYQNFERGRPNEDEFGVKVAVIEIAYPLQFHVQHADFSTDFKSVTAFLLEKNTVILCVF
jgi:hypothetical protein